MLVVVHYIYGGSGCDAFRTFKRTLLVLTRCNHPPGSVFIQANTTDTLLAHIHMVVQSHLALALHVWCMVVEWWCMWWWWWCFSVIAGKPVLQVDFLVSMSYICWCSKGTLCKRYSRYATKLNILNFVASFNSEPFIRHAQYTPIHTHTHTPRHTHHTTHKYKCLQCRNTHSKHLQPHTTSGDRHPYTKTDNWYRY